MLESRRPPRRSSLHRSQQRGSSRMVATPATMRSLLAAAAVVASLEFQEQKAVRYRFRTMKPCRRRCSTTAWGRLLRNAAAVASMRGEVPKLQRREARRSLDRRQRRSPPRLWMVAPPRRSPPPFRLPIATAMMTASAGAEATAAVAAAPLPLLLLLRVGADLKGCDHRRRAIGTDHHRQQN